VNTYRHGWYQLAFERDLAQPVTPLGFAARALMAVRTPATGQVRVFDAVCPHRGAHLGHGGRPVADGMVCPFHGYRVGLGEVSQDGFCVGEYLCLVQGGGLFVRLSDRSRPDFPRGLQELGAGHTFIPAFEMTVQATMELVIENGFDSAHFRAVHHLMSLPGLVVGSGPFGELVADGRFEIPWVGSDKGAHAPARRLQARYRGHAFSPGTFIAELEGDPPYRYRIMTTATPADVEGTCTIRITLLLPNPPDGPSPDEGFARQLIEYSRDGLEQDRAIWNRLDLRHVPRFTSSDQPAIAFADFCRVFRGASEPRDVEGEGPTS
jgi:nitrite reductase/ring-hydroxylating ferredoxin subunit